jgi:hypothetical protein
MALRLEFAQPNLMTNCRQNFVRQLISGALSAALCQQRAIGHHLIHGL